VEAWIGTPDEVDFCPPQYPLKHIYIFIRREEASKNIVFCFV
jgi:hypothetical protein